MNLQLMPGLPQPPYAQELRNEFSQYGEDGLLAWVLRHVPDCPRYFVEFGAWDGLHLSNCAALARQGWKGCFIEGDPVRAQDAVARYKDAPGIEVQSAWVTPTGPGRLDELLRPTACPKDFGVLSIDIDGNDYHVWDSVREYRPAICIIEFNPTIPAQVDFVQPLDLQLHQGCSLTALHRLSATKGYVLVAATELNGVFVRADLAQRGGLPSYAPAQVKTITFETHVFHGYDGTVHGAGHGQLVWHGVPLRVDSWQPLPPELRKFPVGQPDAYHAALSRLRGQ